MRSIHIVEFQMEAHTKIYIWIPFQIQLITKPILK